MTLYATRDTHKLIDRDHLDRDTSSYGPVDRDLCFIVIQNFNRSWIIRNTHQEWH